MGGHKLQAASHKPITPSIFLTAKDAKERKGSRREIQKSKVKSQNRTPYLKRKTNNSSIVKLVQRLVLRLL
jgi:hypothetical protein